MEVPRYFLIQSQIVDEEEQMHNTYGIACRTEDGGVERIEDISTDRNAVFRIAQIFNLCNLRTSRFLAAVRMAVSMGSEGWEPFGFYDEPGA